MRETDPKVKVNVGVIGLLGAGMNLRRLQNLNLMSLTLVLRLNILHFDNNMFNFSFFEILVTFYIYISENASDQPVDLMLHHHWHDLLYEYAFKKNRM